jgi:hypothetical protein
MATLSRDLLSPASKVCFAKSRQAREGEGNILEIRGLVHIQKISKITNIGTISGATKLSH